MCEKCWDGGITGHYKNILPQDETYSKGPLRKLTSAGPDG